MDEEVLPQLGACSVDRVALVGSKRCVHPQPVLLISLGSYFDDRPKSLLIVFEPLLCVHFNICYNFGGK
jgi:hypothetical protein